MFNKTASDSGKQALMRIDDLEARLNMQFAKGGASTVVLKGNPSATLDNRVIQLGKMSCKGSKVAIIFKHIGQANVELLIDRRIAIVDDSSIGIAFASIDIEKNQEMSIEVKGSKTLESFEIYFTGDNVMVDGAVEFGIDYLDGIGLAAIAEGGSVYYIGIDGQTFSKPKLLMAGQSVDVSRFGDEIYVLVLDYLQNVWMFVLDLDFKICDMIYLYTGADAVTLNCTSKSMEIAFLKNGKANVSSLNKGHMQGCNEIDLDGIRGLKWVKQCKDNVLILSLKDKRNIALKAFEAVDYSSLVNVEVSCSML